MKAFLRCFIFLIALTFSSGMSAQKVMRWESEFAKVLPELGHRNWVLVVDEAFPLQSNSSFQTIITNDNIEDVSKKVLSLIDKSAHVKPIVYLDKEYDYMDAGMCPGIVSFKSKMNGILRPYDIQKVLHDDVFGRMSKVSDLFKVVVLKTNCHIPYSSIFIELDCGYWTADKEKALRDSMKRN